MIGLLNFDLFLPVKLWLANAWEIEVFWKSLPTEDEYIQVVQELVKKWPDLDGGKGILCVHNYYAHNYAFTAAIHSHGIRMKMTYLRKPGGMRGDPSRCKVYSPTVKMPIAHIPTIPYGEDDASLTRHMNMLKREMKKVNPIEESVRMLMQITFSVRRSWTE